MNWMWVNNIISTRGALTDLDNSQLQLNRHIAFIYVVIVFYLLSKARSCWHFSICSAAKWVVWCLLDFLAQPMFGWPQGGQKKQRQTLEGWLPWSLFVEETCKQVDSVWWYLCAKSVKFGGGEQPNGSLALFLQYIVMVLYPCRYMLGFQSSFVQRMSLGWIH